eukprot:CAMPEP_0116956262 /NCGR_PEP_ID=MMETSP0467-20121206/43216_1 /TAXON_ID=283647 /ORGANISM="Mesodinium pulex, Strain SPMC105" /LENGTH=101 /DNA_ID=CAMNT_0004642677 /DNA_START=105 /DNA_END=406 /DNA_ORIENTATION=+
MNVTKEGHFEFKGTSEGKAIEAVFDLFGEVNVEESKCKLSGVSSNLLLKKNDTTFWETLEKERTSKTKPYVQIDWSKWVDEDEIDGAKAINDDGMGGMPGG